MKHVMAGAKEEGGWSRASCDETAEKQTWGTDDPETDDLAGPCSICPLPVLSALHTHEHRQVGTKQANPPYLLPPALREICFSGATPRQLPFPTPGNLN